MKLISTNQTQWQNKHEIFTEDIKTMYIAGNDPDMDALTGYNDTTIALQKMIGDAKQNGTPFRPLGAGWSWTKIATANQGIMLDTKQLNTTLTLTDASVKKTYKGDIRKLLFAQCGNGIWELSKQLRPMGLSLKTSGASSGQTIVGAMATAAHGSSIDVGAIPDYVVGMHVITGPDKHIWLERKSSPVVKQSFIQKLNTTLVQDDDLFNSVLVSFGSIGFIHGVLLETDDLFLMETYMRRMPYDDTLKALMSTLDFSNATLPCGNERPFHFSVFLNPYDMDKGAYVSTYYKRPYRDDYVRPVANAEGIGPGDDAPCFIGKLTDAVPALVPVVVNKLLSVSLTLYEKQFGTLAEIFGNTSLHGKLLSAAIGIPIDKVNRVTEILLEINKTNGPFVGLFAYRFIKKCTATLGFQRFPYTCILELDAAYSDGTKSFYTAVWSRLEQEQIPFTFHWGKMNELNIGRITNMYGKDADTWIAARNKLLAPDNFKVFTNPLLTEWGLDKVL